MPSALPSSSPLGPHDLRRLGASLARRYEPLIGEGVPAHLAMPVRAMQVQRVRPTPLPPARILIVEDDPHVRMLAELVLDEIAVVIDCESAEAALAVMRARGGEIAMVFADLRLAGTASGLDLATAIARHWPATRVLLTSGIARDAPAGLHANAGYLPKPWRCADLLAQAQAAIVAR